jgi:hypothetical protein
MIGDVTGQLFVATGVFYAPLTNASGDRYQDNQGRDWTTFGLAGNTE